MLDFYLLIPCYNNTDGLIRSLLSVEYPKEKYKVLVVDDGSTVPVSLSKLPAELLQKQTIEIIRLSQNQGITEALNTGLRLILNRNDSLYTARLDCGDTCTADRFTKQISFLSVNTDVALLGSLCLFVDKRNNNQFIYRANELHSDILVQMHWKCSFIHSTVVFRNKFLKETELYPYNYPHAEDYALFFQMAKKYKTHIIQDVLIDYEINTEGISIKNRKEQVKSKIRIIKKFGTHYHLILWGLMKQIFLSSLPISLSFFSKKIFYSK